MSNFKNLDLENHLEGLLINLEYIDITFKVYCGFEHENSNHIIFMNRLCHHSENKNYYYAILEWKLYINFPSYKKEKCLCGHDIENLFIVQNIINKKKLLVGCVCIDKIGDCPLKREMKYYEKIKSKTQNITLNSDNIINKKLQKYDIAAEKLLNKYYIKLKKEVSDLVNITHKTNILFGKYKNMSFYDIICTDFNYIKWFYNVRKNNSQNIPEIFTLIYNFFNALV
jgi:hypothetical protein